MRVALNATCFNSRPSGAKQRFLGIHGNLVRNLPNCEFVIFEPVDCRMDSWFNNAPNVRTISTPIPSEGRFDKLINAYKFWKHHFSTEDIDIFEGFHLPFPNVLAHNRILTIHDIRRLHPRSSWIDRSVFRFALNQAVSVADLIITVSDAMKQELLPFCGNTPIHVISNGLDADAFGITPAESDLQSFRRKYTLPETFILAVGHLEQRKNYHRLLDAFYLLRKNGYGRHLLVVGNDSGERSKLESHINKLDLNDSVTILSGLTDLDLRCAYVLSQLFVFPSLYEGFGIPILEAMALGKPMALANIPVFREITNDNSTYFNPEHTTDIALKIHEILSFPDSQNRLIDSGRKRVLDFTYEKIGLQYLQLYRSLIN